MGSGVKSPDTVSHAKSWEGQGWRASLAMVWSRCGTGVCQADI